MKRLCSAVATAGVLALSSSALYAADLPVVQSPAPQPAMVVPEGYDWTGFYLGGFGAYGWGDTTIDPQGSDIDVEGLFGGGTVGYNYQFQNNLVIGIEGDIGAGNLDDVDVRTVVPPINLEVFGSADVNYLATVRGRVGYAFGRFLPYVTGGLAVADIDVATGFNSNRDDPVFSGSETHVGYAVGGGLEYGVTDRISIKAEYMYIDGGEEEYFQAGTGPFNPDTTQDVDFDMHTAKLGVNFRF